jgi:adenylate cyclase
LRSDATALVVEGSAKIMSAPSVLGELIPCGGGDPIPLLKPKLLVGRRSHCDIQLQFPNVSSHHCELEYINSFWRVQDLNSSNGVKVNGVRVDSTKWLMPGDIVSVGKNRYEIAYVTDGQSPPEEDDNPFARGLLEKAGLERTGEMRRRSAPPPPAVTPVAPKPPTPPKQQPTIDDDEAMKWLSDM